MMGQGIYMKKLICLSLAFHMAFAPTLVMGQTLDESFATTKPLTDQEQDQANNYFHQGIAGDYLKKECGKLSKEYKTQLGCQDETGAPGQVLGGSLGGVLEEMIPRLYGMIGMVAMATGGGSITMKTGEPTAAVQAQPTANPPIEAKPASDGTEKKKDACIYIPMAGEAISQVAQQVSERNIQNQMADKQKQNSLGDQQKESLYAVANVHKGRAKTSMMQATVFGATSACYAAYIAKGGYVDKMAWVKFGAAALVATIYIKKADKHKKYAAAVRKVADGLPGDGECNPFTQTQCFCSEASSQKVDPTNYVKACVPPELANNGNANPNAIPCATIQNGQAKVDTSCSCKRNNSCLNGQLQARAASIDFGGVNMADPLRLLNEMNGEFDPEKIEPIIGSINARAKKAVSGLPVANVPSVTLDDKNRRIAKELAGAGVPARVAAFAAGSNIPSVSPGLAASGALSNLPSLEEESSGSRQGTSYNPSSSSRSNRNSGSRTDFTNPFAKGGKQEAVQVETFAEQAFAEAEITKDTSIGIFDLISNRYRRSGWSRVDMEKQMPPESEVPVPNPSSAP
jgi:hypothetical protein